MQMNPHNPLIVQGDGSVLLETQHKTFDEMRDFLAQFAELEASPELLHTYRITPLSLWNAASAGLASKARVATAASRRRILPDCTRPQGGSRLTEARRSAARSSMQTPPERPSESHHTRTRPKRRLWASCFQRRPYESS